MPCNSDYLDPNDAEKDSRRVANLLIYVNTELGNVIPKIIKDAAKDFYGNPEKLDEMVVSLCALCGSMTTFNQNRIIYDARNKTARDLADWWEEHQAADRERIKEEKNLAHIRKLKKSALAKLSKAERKALKID